MVNAFGDLESSFDAHVRIRIDDLLKRHADRIPVGEAAMILAESNSYQRLQRLFATLAQRQLPLYLFIDEYDHFANNVLISLDPEFSGLLGFNHAEMDALFRAFEQDFSIHRAIIDDWYNHYHFHKVRRETIINSDMALYYLPSLHRLQTPPDELIDHNVRIDYGKLRHLVQIARRLNGNFSRLREIIETGEQVSTIQTSFPVEGSLRQENFIINKGNYLAVRQGRSEIF
jgi:hypothetical protein